MSTDHLRGGGQVTLEHYLAHVVLFTNADTAEQGQGEVDDRSRRQGLNFPMCSSAA